MFLLACAGFIYFAFQQEVNLVHKDYYEKGVGHTEQMKVNSRSASFKNAFEISNQEQVSRMHLKSPTRKLL